MYAFGGRIWNIWNIIAIFMVIFLCANLTQNKNVELTGK